MELSASALTSAKPGAILRDKTVPGLHAKITPTGRRFYLYFRTKAGVERRPKIGEHPLMTVAQARAIAKDMLLEVAKGNDPSAQRQAERLAPTVSEAIDKYEREHAPKRKSGAAAVKLLRAHLERKLGSEKVAAIDHGHIHALHASMSKTPILANRVVQHASKLFSLCELWKFRTPDQVNPCRGIERFPEKKRKRYMTPAEAKAVADALDKYKAEFPQAVAYIYLLILTGTRRGEIWEARWEWLDGNVLRLPDSKTGAKDVFLPPPAMEIIDQLPRTNGTITGIGPPYKLWYKVRKEAKCPDLRLHDLRHSFASAALAQGLTLEQIGELLGHASTQTTKRYAHLVDATAHAAAARTASAVLADMRGKRDERGADDRRAGSGHLVAAETA
jgi:integrase